MKKRILGTVLAAVLCVMGTITAFAADSKDADMKPSGGSTGYYEVEKGTSDNLSDIKSDVAQTIVAVNGGSADLQSVGKGQPSLQTALGGKTMVTPFFSVKPVNGGVQKDGKYVFTVSVPALTKDLKNVQFLLYSETKGEWTVVQPDNIDLDAKTITISAEEISVVSVIADKAAGGTTTTPDGDSNKSPETGSASAWALLLGAAVVCGTISAVSYRKASR